MLLISLLGEIVSELNGDNAFGWTHRVGELF
jgi:hypothetical protein